MSCLNSLKLPNKKTDLRNKLVGTSEYEEYNKSDQKLDTYNDNIIKDSVKVITKV